MKKILQTIIVIIFCYFPIATQAEIKPIIEGSNDAKIKIIIFESLTCSHCANFHKKIYPSLKKDFIDKGHVSIEFKNFPLDMAAFNGSKIAHCKNDGNSEILHYLFENQSQWVKGSTIEDLNKNLENIIKKSSFNLNFNECLNKADIEDFILEERITGSKKYKIEATPTLIINGEKFENASNYKKLKKYLEKLI
tara:strand:- start:3 stop:584 length:582 start_codon:yes stop_codon:yes gene_type:complete